MFQDKPEWIAHQRQRWMRPDAERWFQLDAQRWMTPEAQRWLLPDRKLRPQLQPDDHGLDLAAEREWLRRMRGELASLKAELKFRQFFRSLKAGFNPSQLRDELGRWTDAGGSSAGNDAGGGGDASDGEAEVQEILGIARRLNLAATPANYQKCLNLCYPLLERRQPPWSDRNTWDFHKCMNACLKRNL